MPSPGQKAQRGSRVKLDSCILLLIVLENGQQIRGRVCQLSTNGGLAALECGLDENIPVTVLFHLGITSVRGSARMMFPVRAEQRVAAQGYLQPFRFVELPEASGISLGRELSALIQAGAAQEKEEEFEEAEDEVV